MQTIKIQPLTQIQQSKLDKRPGKNEAGRPYIAYIGEGETLEVLAGRFCRNDDEAQGDFVATRTPKFDHWFGAGQWQVEFSSDILEITPGFLVRERLQAMPVPDEEVVTDGEA